MRSAPTPPPRLAAEEGVALGGAIALFAITCAWWALALWPVQDGPAWLERTRLVCFGVAESGLPDAGGWIGLIGGPLGMFAILLAGWGDGFRSLTRRARTSRPVAAVLWSLVLGTVLLAGGGLGRVRQEGNARTIADTIVATPAGAQARLDRAAPALALIAHDGATRSIDQLRGRPVLVTFAFAHCETVCPLVIRDVLAARERLDSIDRPPAVLIVTLDPWRDTPSRLPAMASAWSLPERDVWVLGGEVAAVEATLDAWEVPRSRDLRTGEVTHPSLVYIVDADGRIAFVSTGGADAIADLVRRL
jgi:protein SCO1/2